MLRRTNGHQDARAPQSSHPEGPVFRDFKTEAWFISALARASLVDKAQVDRFVEPSPFFTPEGARANARPLPPIPQIPQRVSVKFQKPLPPLPLPPLQPHLRNKRLLAVKKMGFVDCTEPQPKLPFGPGVLDLYPSEVRHEREMQRKSLQVHECISYQAKIQELDRRMSRLADAQLAREFESPDVV